jgi:hypothetical protein
MLELPRDEAGDGQADESSDPLVLEVRDGTARLEVCLSVWCWRCATEQQGWKSLA